MRTVRIGGVEAEVASTFRERARGLIARAAPPPGRGLLIEKCNCIHTCFMRYPIDAVFFDRAGRVVRAVRGIRPWRLWVWGGWRAVKVLETAAEKGAVAGGAPARDRPERKGNGRLYVEQNG